jgi:cyclopropane fatty-acyl-phospholipid synthase-like methyltransferase
MTLRMLELCGGSLPRGAPRDLWRGFWTNELVTTEESREIPELLDLNTNSSVLEMECGSGGYALHLEPNVGCSLVGLDVNTPKYTEVRNANQLAVAKGLSARGTFRGV